MIYLDEAINKRWCVNGHTIKGGSPHFREDYSNRCGNTSHINWCIPCGIREILHIIEEYNKLLDTITIKRRK